MRVLVCGGSPGAATSRKIAALVAGLAAGDVVVVGDRPGVEQELRDAVEERPGLTAHVFHPEEFVGDLGAVEIDRARRMLAEGQPDVIWTLGGGRDAQLLTDLAADAGVRVERFTNQRETDR